VNKTEWEAREKLKGSWKTRWTALGLFLPKLTQLFNIENGVLQI